MSHQKRNNITYLDELIDLDDDSSDMPNPNQYQKFIRNYSQIAPESGMGVSNVTRQNYNHNIHSQELVDNSKENNDYKSRKKLGISSTLNILMNDIRFNDQLEYFKKHKKKDDLADSFLQGLWYISTFDK